MTSYHELGVEPIINACGSVTRLGGAPMPPEVLDAFRTAAGKSVSLEQLHAAASRKIAAVTETEAGLVTAGSSAALTLGAAAIMTGFDLSRMEGLPQSDGFPNEFVIAREQRSGYDHAVRASGARLVEVGFNEIVAGAGVRRTEVWEFEAAFGPNTAGVVYVLAQDSQPPLEQVVTIAHQHKLPVLVDAAGELPPRDNLKRIGATGADLVAFSGGKAIRGPQSTGILCGRQDLIAAATLQMLDMDDHWELWDPPPDWINKTQLPGIPRHGVGRALKVSKEEIIALLTALELFSSGVYDEQLPSFLEYLNTIAAALVHSQVNCRIIESPDGERWPLLELHLNDSASAVEVCQRLRRGSPPVYVSHGRLTDGILVVNPLSLKGDQIEPLAVRLRDEIGD